MTLKAIAKRIVDGALRRLGLVRTAASAAQMVDAIYLSHLGRGPDVRERAESAAALKNGQVSLSALIDSLGASAEGRSRLWDTALPVFLSAGYVEPSAHFEQLVEIAFLTALGRRPEAEALCAYEGALRSGALSVDAFVDELSSTQEAVDRILRQGYLNKDSHLEKLVDAIFLAVLGRSPEDEARAAYVGALRSGALSVDAFVDELSSAQEAADRILGQGYLNQEGHLEKLVQAMFLAALGRSAEDEACAAYVGALRSERLSIRAFSDELICTSEAAERLATKGYLDQGRQQAQIVDAMFLALLGRLPDAEARIAYTESLKSGRLSFEDFASELLRSGEADDRIQSAGYVNRQTQLNGLVDVVFKTALGRHDAGAAATFAGAIETGDYTLDRVIDELSTCPEAKKRALALVEPVLRDHGYSFKDEHYAEIVDVMFRSIVGRPADDAGRKAFVGDLIAGRITVEKAIERLMNSDEVRLRVRDVGLPDVLEGIYRTIMGAPETDPALQGLVRSAASQHTFETIKNMTLSAEARHYIMRPILKAQSQQFLSSVDVQSVVGA